MSDYYPYPVFINMRGRSCIVVGGGKVALRKISDLLETGANVTVVAETPDPIIEDLAQKGNIKLFRRLFKPEDIENAFLVFTATDDDSVNAEIAGIAKKYGALVNVVDNPQYCDFFTGAVVKRGPLRIAISTSGCSPGIAAEIRRELNELYGESFASFLQTVGEMRQYVLSLDDITRDKKNNALKWLSKKETLTLFIDSGKGKVWDGI
ncbi:unnamed protein product, partial [marine sediment metagenome]